MADDQHCTQDSFHQGFSPKNTRTGRLFFGAEKAWSASGLDIKHRVFQSVAILAACRGGNLSGDVPRMHASAPRRAIDIEHLSARMEAGNVLVDITAASLAKDVGVVCWRANRYRSRRSAP